jgi:hypothetical protein
MNFARVGDPEAVLDWAEICGIQAGVLKVQCLFEIAQSIPKFVGLSEKASIVVVSDCPQPLVVFCEELSLLQKILAELEVFLLEMSH